MGSDELSDNLTDLTTEDQELMDLEMSLKNQELEI
jgi:hypothetical protein